MRIPTLLVAIALATPAAAFDPVFRLRVTQTSATDFTVEYDSQAKTTDYWCAAGNFATNTLRLSDRTRVYRASPDPRQQGKGISFSLDPARSIGQTGLTTFGGPQDGSFSAGGAYAQFCFQYDEDF